MSHHQPQRSPVALGGILAALAAVCGFLSQLLPFFFSLLAPLPLALAALWLPRSMALACGVVAALLLGLFSGPLAGVSFLLRTVLLGWVIGFLVKGRRHYAVLFTAATLAQVSGTLLYLLLTLAISGTGATFLAQFSGDLTDNMLAAAEDMNPYETLATNGMSAAEAEQLFRHAVQLTVQLSPAIYVLMFAVVSGAVLLLLHLLCQRLRLDAQVTSPSWQSILMPPAVLVPFLAAWILLLVERHFDNQVLWIVAANVMVIGAAAMAMDGFSYCLAKLKFTEKPFMVQLLYLMLALLMGWYLIVVFAVIGVFDSIADYRHLRSQKGDNTQ